MGTCVENIMPRGDIIESNLPLIISVQVQWLPRAIVKIEETTLNGVRKFIKLQAGL